ncbi:MAG: class B sortase [Eubacterium sp.]|nr:class B sortase [Eubacterium sp.]
MSGKYRIGDYEFNTYEEYLAAQEDAKKIDFITKELDITDPDVAVRLYTLIRNKEIVFRTKLGISFSWYVMDVLAQNSQKLLEEKRRKDEQKQKGKKLGAAGCMCILAAVFCLGYYGVTLWQEHLESQEFERLQNMQNLTGHLIRESSVDDEQEGSASQDAGGEDAQASDKNAAKTSKAAAKKAAKEKAEKQAEKKIDPADLTVLKKYRELYKQNKDLAGWLSIEGTVINYPVMQTGSKNPDYYLHHDFEKKESDHGTLFVDARNDYVNRDTNLIIYGHNMRDGTMFGGLKRFMEKEYFEQHQKLVFDTIYEKAEYQIVAVCLSKVNYQDDHTFRYYNFLNAADKEEFNAFLANIQQLTVFDQKIDLSYGDELLTLSTCNSYVQDGRLFLIAKKE